MLNIPRYWSNGNHRSGIERLGASGIALVQFGNGDVATTIGDGFTSAGGSSLSLLGNADFAENLGSLMSATAGSGDGVSGSFDIAAILAQGTGDANATGGNFLVDILPSLF